MERALGKMMRLLRLAIFKTVDIARAFLFVIGLLITSYFVFHAIASVMQGYSWKEMDWHARGSTSLSDFYDAADIGKREVMVNNRVCFEYFYYKDNIPFKTVCPKSK